MESKNATSHLHGPPVSLSHLALITWLFSLVRMPGFWVSNKNSEIRDMVPILEELVVKAKKKRRKCPRSM